MSILGRKVQGKTVAALVAAMLLVAGLLPALSKEPSREIVLVAKDMAFRVDGRTEANPPIEVRAGETVRIVLRNRDRGITHDFAVPALDAATRALETDEEDALTFTAPKDEGTYEYLCRPHLLMMKGTLRVVR